MLHVCGRDALFTALGGSALEQLVAQWLGWTQSSGRWMCYAMLQRARDDSSSSISGVAGSCQPRPDRHCERRVETGAGSGLGLGVGESSSTQAVDTRPPPPPAWGKGRFTKVCVCVSEGVCGRACVQQGRQRWCSSANPRTTAQRQNERDAGTIIDGWLLLVQPSPSHAPSAYAPPAAYCPPPLPHQHRAACPVPGSTAQHSTAHRGGVRLVNCAMGRESGGSVWWGRQRARPGAKLVGAWR